MSVSAYAYGVAFGAPLVAISHGATARLGFGNLSRNSETLDLYREKQLSVCVGDLDIHLLAAPNALRIVLKRFAREHDGMKASLGQAAKLYAISVIFNEAIGAMEKVAGHGRALVAGDKSALGSLTRQ